MLFQSEILTGSIRAQVIRLKRILDEIESDEKYMSHGFYYAKEIKDVERSLRAIRKNDLERINTKDNVYITAN